MMKRIVAIANSASSKRDRNEWVSQTEPHGAVDEKKKKKRQNAITAWSLPYSSYIHTSAWSFCVSYMSRLFSLWLAVSPLPAHSESGRGVIFGLIRNHSPGGYHLSVQPRALNVCNHITRPDKVTTTLLSSINSNSQKNSERKKRSASVAPSSLLIFSFFLSCYSFYPAITHYIRACNTRFRSCIWSISYHLHSYSSERRHA